MNYYRPDPLAPYSRGPVYNAVRLFGMLCIGVAYSALGLAVALVIVSIVVRAVA